MGKCLEVKQKFHGSDRKHIKVNQKSQNRQMSYFFNPMPTLIVHISNRPVRFVPWFVGVHHICDAICKNPLDVAKCKIEFLVSL